MQPAAIKSFLDKALTTPEDQLADALEAFTWKADKVRLSSLCSLRNVKHATQMFSVTVITGGLPSLGSSLQLLRCILRATCTV